MATVEEVLYAQVAGDPTVYGLVADRIFPNRLPPAETPLPWVYYSISEAEPLEGIGPALNARHVAEWDILASDYPTAKAIGDAITNALHGFRGLPTVRSCVWAGHQSNTVSSGYHREVRFTAIGPAGSDTSPPPPPPGGFLLENGGFLLLESG